MQRTESLFREIIAQTDCCHRCIREENPRRLLRHLKRRSVLLHQMACLTQEGSEQERTTAREFIKQLLAKDSELQVQVTTVRDSLQTQLTHHRKQRQLATTYRPNASFQTEVVVT